MRSQQRRSIQPQFPENWSWRRTKPVISPEYIAGLTDGEGCFYVNLRLAKAERANATVETHFYVKVRKEDKPMLEAVKLALGCGAIYFQKEKRLNHTECYRYGVNSRQDIRETIIPLFTDYPLLSLKRNDFHIFAQISRMVDRKEHQTEAGFEKIRQLKSQMNYRTRRVRENRSLGGNSELALSYRNPPVKLAESVTPEASG